MIVIIKRLFKFGDKFYKVGKYEAPELYQDHWFLESLIEQGFLTLASIAQKTAAVAKEIVIGGKKIPSPSTIGIST